MSIFNKIEKTKVGSNIFDLTHDRKLSMKMGQLVPIMVQDVIPGDKTTIDSSAFVRFAPLIAPVMHRASTYLHFFYVPNRILWPNWEKFITGGANGTDTSVPPSVEFVPRENSSGSLMDYLGLPTGDDYDMNDQGYAVNQVSVLPMAAYQKIFSDYYRDQNLDQFNGTIGSPWDNERDPLPNGEISVNEDPELYGQLMNIRYRSWQHDYFTSALPWTQKGAEALLPLHGVAPIEYTMGRQPVRNNDGDILDPGSILQNNGPSDLAAKDPNGQIHEVSIDMSGTHEVNLSGATQTSISELRRAFKLQEWLEKNARGGSRYIESIAAHFGVQSSDKRLQRAEYLGGSSNPVKISEVLQMAPGTGESPTPQGNMAGHGISIGSGGKISHYAEEHGYIIGIMSIMPTSSYQQGIPRHFSRFDKFDYYWPEFAHIGEQPIYNKELFISDREEDNDKVFGYTPRYAEYKFQNNTVHGQFRSLFDFWHLGRKFVNLPSLNKDFIRLDPSEVDRIFAVQDGDDNLWCHVLNQVKAQRKMPYFGTPKF